ncbi:hypothetical protein L393_00847 [Klebsiella pneumoniae MGH 47]|nr:hypothetical protein [Klebsiella pneumoniae]EWF53084.1 hypothetical protein L393_00847 [Klebsiella pneumoniae MGH 47]
MTKSTITRERVVALIAEHSYDSALVDALEHLLAAMDSEPYCKERKLFCSTDTARMRKVISVSAGTGDAPLYRHAQPVPVTEHEPIAWLNDAYLARGVVDGEAGSEDAGPGYIPVYHEAQPAPVVPEDFDFNRFNDVVWLECVASNPHMHSPTTSAIARVALELNKRSATMEAEPDRNPVLAYADSYRDMAKQGVDSVPIWSVITDLERNIAPLYRHAQPAPTCESITVTDDMAYAFHHALTDSMIGADDVEEIKTGLRAVFANLTAPVVSAEYPDRLPCSVLLEPGLRFGKGIKTSTMLAALARRVVYESDMAALSPEERAEFQAGIEDFKALIAQPAPVAPVCTCPSGNGSLRWPCPVHPGNSPAIPDAARDALEKALTAMEFMGDTLNNLDAVCYEDVEFVTPAFDAVRRVLAAAPQEPKP